MKLRNTLSLIALFCIDGLLAMDRDQDGKTSSANSDPTHAHLKLIGVAKVFKLTDQQIKQTRFYQAICEGNIHLVRGMVNHGKINPNKVLTAHRLFWFNYLPVTHRTVYADPNKFKDGMLTAQHFLPLTLAITQNNPDIVRFLVEECNVNINDCAKDISRPLFAAVDNYDENLVQYLIDHGANPLYKNSGRATPRTVLEQINNELLQLDELGPDRIAELQTIKPIIEKALKTGNYLDPYAEAESSSSSGSSTPLPSAASTNTNKSLPKSLSAHPSTSSGRAISSSVSAHPEPVEGLKQATAVITTAGLQNKHKPQNISVPPHHMSHTKYSWSTIALSALGITCGIVCIKKLYSWYTNAHEADEDTNDQEDDTSHGEHHEIA